MPAPQPAVEINTRFTRLGTNQLQADTIVRFNRGGYPEHAGIGDITFNKGILALVSQTYYPATGLLRHIYEVEEGTDPDVKQVMDLSFDLFVRGEPGFAVCRHREQLGCEEPAPVVTHLSSAVTDDVYTVKFKVRRSNGKIPAAAIVTVGQYALLGLEPNLVLSQSYNVLTGTLEAKYKVKPAEGKISIALTTSVGIKESKTLSEVYVEGKYDQVRSVHTRILATTLSGKDLSVVLAVRYNIDNSIPKTFELKTPFLAATNVPSGQVGITNTNYDPVIGVYEFTVKVKTVPTGLVNYEFKTLAIPDGGPVSEVLIQVGYDHQSTYSMTTQSVTLGNGELTAHFKVLSKDNPKYALEHFAVDDAEYTVGVTGRSFPKVHWNEQAGELYATWEVVDDPTKEVAYDIRGHFIADGKRIPYLIKHVTKPVHVWKESVSRIDGLLSGFNFMVLSDDKVNDVDATGLVVLLNRIPSPIKVVQHTNEDPCIVSGHFQLTPPTDESVEVEVIGSVSIITDIIRKLPVVIKGTDYIPSPSTGNDLKFEVVEHVVSGNVEKLIQKVRFLDGSIPAAVKLEELTLNDEKLIARKCTYRNGLLSLLAEIKPTGFKETHKVKGIVSLPGYQGPELPEFESVLTFGSDTFPAHAIKNEVVAANSTLNARFTVLLKNETNPVSVKCISHFDKLNVEPDKLVQNYKDGELNIALPCADVGENGNTYYLGLVLEVSDGEGTYNVPVDINHFELPEYAVTVEYDRYETKGKSIIVYHKVKSTQDLPKEIKPVQLPYNAVGFTYNQQRGELSYTLIIDDFEMANPFDVSFECVVVGTPLRVMVYTGEKWRCPPATATYINHFFNGDQMTYNWLFRDASDGIPKQIRIEDYWKHNVNVVARTIDLKYDRKTGIGSVTVKADFKIGRKYFAAAMFRFPSPDPLFYPLYIDI